MKLTLLYKHHFSLAVILFLGLSSPVFSQLAGTKSIPGDYPTIANAVTALNTAGVGNGGVIFNIAAGYTETIASTISLTATGTAANPVVFQKDPAGTGANPLITAYTGGTGTPSTSIQDGIWRLVGVDYITIDGIDVRDNPANTSNPSTMEYGYALYKASTSNGCLNVTIRRCAISLSIVNNAAGTAPMVDGSCGIIVMNALPAAAVSAITPVTGGTNSGNKFYKNYIQNCNTGIALTGYADASPFTLADFNNDVGGSDTSTGNTIVNYGGASAAVNTAAAVRTLSQYGLNISYNIINNNNGSGTNHPATLRGILVGTATSAASTITNNIITLNGGGTTQAVTGIENASGSTAAANTVTISNNTIVNCTYNTATTGGFYGINNSAAPAAMVMNNNAISNNSTAATTGFLYGMLNSGSASTVTITNNTFSGNSTASSTTGLFAGIYNTAAAPVVNINSNTIAGNSTASISGAFYAIYNSGSVTTNININSNNIGTGTSPSITFTASNSGNHSFIYNTGGSSTAALSITGNNFYNVLYSSAGTGSNNYISNSAATLSQAINANRFINLNVNTTGSITFILNSVIISATGTQNVNSNSISGSFAKAAGGTVTLFTSSATSVAGGVVNNNDNNFSNITLTGATTMNGWVNTDAGGATKTIRNNTFTFWTVGTAGANGMNINISGSGNAITGNVINNISGSGSITGIGTAAGNDNIYSNIINTLSTSGASAVTGILISSGTTKNIFRNKIYDLVANNAGGTVNGILVSGTTTGVITANIYNNLIGDLRTPVTSATDAIRGISVTSTTASSSINIYYNTIYLNASSTGATFGTTGIYHTASATATTAALNLRNNIITNTSIPNGSGLTVVYRRSGASLANYYANSNNNLFYAGTPATNRLLFYDGTNAFQTLAPYKALVSAKDAQSVTEDLITASKFLSTTGSSTSFLHLDPAKATLAESGAVNISGYTTDFDNQVRQGNSGYTGNGTAPDIGADELEGIQSMALSGTILVGVGQVYTSLTNAGGVFAGINSLGLSSNLIVKITSDLTEDGSNLLNQWTEQGAGTYTLTMQPDASTARTISGNVTTGMIRLNGVTRVVIDGSNGTTSSFLTFRNTNTAGATGTAFTFINGASNNIIRYCAIEAYTNATSGVILFSTSTVTGGNSSNTISNSKINATVSGNTGFLCIYSAGTATAGYANTGNIISDNSIFNYRDRAIDITATGSSAWAITGNSFYNGDVSGSISYAAAYTLHTIRILGGSGYSILSNYIGGNAPLAGGTAAVYSSTAGLLTYQGILLTTTSATPVSNIKGNTIANMSIAAVPTSTSSSGTNVFLGIETNGSGINIGGSQAGEGNMIGSNTVNGSVLITTNTAYKSNLRGINCNSSGGIISGNQVGGIDIRNIGTSAGPSAFIAIYAGNATAPPQIINNIVGSAGTNAVSNSIRVLSTSTSTTTAVTGIYIGSTVTSTVLVSGNTVQNLSYQNTTASGATTGIFNATAATAVITISGNLINGNTVSASTGVFYGIYNNGAPASLTISNNTISGTVSAAGTGGILYGVYTQGAASAVAISNNIFSGNTMTSSGSPGFTGINNSATPASLAINGNSFSGNATSSAAGLFYCITNTGAVTGTININSNIIGTSASAAIAFNAANSAPQLLISNSGGTAAAALSISNNIFQNINYAVAGTGSNVYIINSAATLSQSINGNIFTNLNVNTAGNITFISDNVIVPGTGTQNVNNNSISGTFTKRVGGSVTLFTSSAASASGSVINNNNNNFSNITVPTTTVIAGWLNTDAGSSTKTIQGNTFSNWTGGAGAITALTVNLTGANNSTTGNVISTISSAGPITGITTAAGNDNISFNNINTLSSTGNFAVTGIAVTAGTTKNIYKNKIYALSVSNATGTVNGILVSGGTTVNIYNNLIGDLRATIASSTTDVIRGMNLSSALASSSINVYFNTVYINASSSGTNFSTTGIYHLSSTTSTTASLTLRNNSITNTSTPKGTGFTVCYRRFDQNVNNYATTSNNNLVYAGTPGSARLLYYDGTNSVSAIATYRSLGSPRESASVSEDLTAKFLSTSGSSTVFLHMNASIANAVESAAANIAGFTDDYDGQIRAGNSGYTGTSSLPDIGADEIFGIENVPPVITYSLLDNTTSTANRTVSGVTITDASSVNTTAGTKPRIYYKRFTDANVWLDNTPSTNGWKYTEATNSASPFTFTINYALLYGGAAVTAGVIQYFIVAQDLATIANVAINSGTFAAVPASVALTAAAFPVTGTINSYNIPFSGVYNIGSAEIFTSLTKADGLFAAVNTVGLMGTSTFNITSDLTEDGTNALNQWTESGAGNYKLTLQPDGSSLRTVSGNVPAGLIRLNGADRVVIDGSNGSSSAYMNFKNTNTAGTTGTAFTLLNGATNNTIKYCVAEAFANATNGVILFSTSSAGGNNNNLIDNCTIHATVGSNTGNVAIYSAGTAGNENSSNTISNNIIYDYRDRGLDISATGSTAWIITGNSLYNGTVAGTINYAASSTLHGIRVLGGSGYSILNNYIGGNDDMASGSNAVYASTSGNVSYQGILLSTGSASPESNIRGNKIAGISVISVPAAAGSTAFTGIETNGAGINIGGSNLSDGNTIGAVTGNGSIVVTTATSSPANTSVITGINCLSSGGVVNNNSVSGFDITNSGTSPASSVFQGIDVNNAASPTQVNNNVIGSPSASASIRVLPVSASTAFSITGIQIGQAVNNSMQVSGNRINNISNLSATSSGSFTGINNAATLSSAMITISSDTVQNISTAPNSNAGSTLYAGIVSGSASAINNNVINNITLSSSGTIAQVTGITVSGAYATTISGNSISNLSTLSGKAIAAVETGSPAGAAILGILNSTTAGAQVISNNRLFGFSAMSAAAVNVVVAGLGITSTGSGNIYGNRFEGCTNLSTGSAPVLCHIMAAGGSFNVYNNTLRISNLTNTNSVKIYGIIHSSTTGWNYFHNSIRVSGGSNGSALRSAAFLLSVNSPVMLKNNIFFNVRAGTGTHYAVSNLSSPPASWAPTSSDYNDLYSVDPNTVGEWGSGAGVSFTQWKNLSGGDVHSINNAISFIQSTFDLEPDSITNCNINNAGTPITMPVVINTDINNAARSTVNPDLGAYEFNYTGFAITVGSNTPVCSGEGLELEVDPGNALVPRFTWRNPANTIISTIRNPVVAVTAGQFKVTVTDSTGCSVTDSTLVSINPRPTARITAQSSLCDGGVVILNINVTGTGVISGTLSNGDDFSGTAPLIKDTVTVTGTTSYYISNLSDAICSAIAADIPDTVTVSVTHKGDWLGITSKWSDPVNWCEGIVPTSTVNVNIPAGTAVMPVVTDSAFCNNLTISAGDTLTINATGIIHLSGNLISYGKYTDNGTTDFNGVSAQQTFSGVSTFHNLTLNNANGLLVSASCTITNSLTISKGILNANNFNLSVKGNWINNASASGFLAGNGTTIFNGTTGQSIGGAFSTTFNDLTVSNTGTGVNLQMNAVVGSNLLLSAGVFDLGGFTCNRATAGGLLTVSNNTTLKIGGTNSFPANYTAVNLVVAGNVEYSGTNQSVANKTYGNLVLSSASGAVIKTFPAESLSVVGNLISYTGNGTAVSFTAGGNINVNGSVSVGAGTTFNGGSYTHNIGGGWVNNGTFNGSTSTVVITGSGTTVSGTGVQNFNNLTVSASDVVFSSSNITLTGNLATTVSGSFSQGSASTLVMSGTGKTISGSGISLNNLAVTGSVSTTELVDIKGNITVSGSLAASGTITMSGSSKTLSGSGTKSFAVFSIPGSVTTDADFFVSSGLAVGGSLSASAGTATFTGTSTLSGTANLYNVTINGTYLRLAGSSVLGIANALTITSGTLDVMASGSNTVNFNGSGAQNINGIAYSYLVLSNGNTKTAAGSIATSNDITIGAATTFNPSSHTHSIYGNWINNGTFLAGTGTIQFVGPANAYISGVTAFNILTSNTSSSTTQLILQSNVSAVTVNMINGRILTGSSTLTITGSRTGNGIILGNIRRTHAFMTGVAYAFESPVNTITFSAVSAVTSVTVSVAKGMIGDFPFGGSISRSYTISVPAGTYNATLRLHYEDDELNGNTESSVALWHYNGSAWMAAGKSANDTSANYAEQSGLTDITGRWTLSDDANLVQWNGSVSSDWNTAANWTVQQGAGSRPPSSSDIVDLGTGSFVNQPTISGNVTVKNVIFGSVQAVTLTIANGGSLTTLGDINGSWSTNAKHTINVNNQSLTVNGDLNLSDNVNGRTIDVNIGAGSVTITGSLTESGGANITFLGAGTLRIYKNFNYSSGTFTAGSGTVVYNGNDNQAIATLRYNNVIINKTAALAAVNDSIYVAGNLLISSGVLDNFSVIAVAGNVTIAAGGTINNYNAVHVQGNWNNNGTYLANGSKIYFDGAGTQTISASTFNNLVINKPVGSLAVLTGDIILKGNLNGVSGTLDIGSFFFNRDVIGGTAMIGDSATLIIAADNAPNKFASYFLAPNSTVVFNGAGTQHLQLPGVVYGNLTFRNTGVKILYTSIVVNNRLLIESGTSFDAGANNITLNGNWQNNGTFIPSTSNVVFAGISKTLSGNTTFYRSTITGSYNVVSDIRYNKLLEITSTGSITSNTGIATIVDGDLINSGVLITNGTATFTGQVLQTLSLINAVTTYVQTVNFNGSVSPILNSTTAPEFFSLNINNTGGVNPSVGWTTHGLFTVSSGASFNGGPSTHIMQGSVTNNGIITSSGTMNFSPATPATVNLGTGFSSTGTVIFGGTGAMTLTGTPASFYDLTITNTNSAGITPSSDWQIANNFTLTGGSTLNASHYTLSVGDDILSIGTINGGTSTFILNGTGLQEISTVSAFNNLTVSKAAGTVSLSSDVAVNGMLNFVSGQIQTGVHRLIQPSSGAVTGAAQNTGWVNGLLQKNITSGGSAKIFEVGDAVTYTPVSVSFSGIISAGDLAVSSIAGDHPNIGSSPVNAARSVNRFWSFINSGIVYSDYSTTFRYVPADIDSGANAASFGVALYNGSSWGLPRTVSPTDSSIQATGIKAFGDFVVGEVCYAGTTIAYMDSLYCTNAGIAPVTRTGAGGGTYSSGTGLSVDAATGAIDLGSSTPGYYVITYTIAANGGCSVYVTQAAITIVAAPSAVISYPGNPYCSGAGTVQVTRTGTSGGAYSSTPGLSVDAVTGDIDLSLSAAGSYTVAYTIAAGNGCRVYQVTTPVTITALPSATIDYSGSPYCNASGVSPVTLTGTAGGVYTSSTGLSVDAITGSVNAGASAEGTYTVTYTVAAANGCSAFTTSASVAISAAPSAVISYNGNPFCNVPGTGTPSLSGTSGGTYSSTAGLSIDTGNGNINTGTSAPGTYLVTYTIAAGYGCGQFTTTTSVTINISGTWSGAVSTNWNTPENWQCNAVPGSTTNVTIPAGLSIYPTINTGTSSISNLMIEAGASLTVTGAILQIGGTIANNGSFDVYNGTVVMNGSSAQTVPAGAFTGNTIRNFRVNNSTGVTLGGALNLTNALTITDGSLTTGGFLTLKSDVAANARVAPITSVAAMPVIGNVTVERYVPGQRRYRLITSPVTSNSSSTLIAGQENMSIWGNWQNSGNNVVANNGTYITGGSSAGGFDQQTTNASLYTYDAVRRAYIGFTTVNGKNTKYTPLKAGIAYYMFIYGDRTNSIFTSSPNPTVINSTGTLTTGNQVYNPQSAIPLSADTGMFTLLGNPFASSINWAVLPRTGLDNTYWGWDPNLSNTGGYVTVNTSGAITLQAPFSGTTGLNQYIQSGQGFFVRTSGPSPQLIIREQDKVANFNGNAFGTPIDANTLPLLAINLQYISSDNTILADGVLVAFDSSFTNKPGPEDAVKMANSVDNIAIVNENVQLSIDTRKMPQHTDTVFLNLSKLGRPRYSLQIFAKQMENTGINVYLEDRYLNTTQPLLLSDTNNIIFDINAGIPASFDANRFRIVFHSSVISLPVTYTSIQAFQKNDGIQVNWNVAKENGIMKYEIEKSVNGIDFYKAGEVTAGGNNLGERYQWFDMNPVTGNNFYRIRALQEDHRSFLGKTVLVYVGGAKWSIKVFPNPIVNKQINILSDYMEKGRYTVQIHNTVGQQIAYLEIDHRGGKLNQVVYIKKMLPSGMYYLKIGNGKEIYRQPLFIE